MANDFVRNKEFTGVQTKDNGTLYYGRPDPATGQRYETFVSNMIAAPEGVAVGRDIGGPKSPIAGGGMTGGVSGGGGITGAGGGAVGGAGALGGAGGDITSQVNAFFDGLETPMSAEQIAARERADKERLFEQAGALFDPRIARAEKLGEKQVGSAKGQVGISRGLGLSTAETSFINSIQAEVDTNIKEIQAAKDEYIANGNFAASQRADEALERLKSTKIEIALNKANLTLDFMNQARADREYNLKEKEFLANQRRTEMASVYDMASAELGIISQIPQGQTMNLGGREWTGIAVQEVEPFFKGNDIVSIMKDIPFGQAVPIQDPNTGQELEIMGLKTEEPNTRAYQFVDSNNNVVVATVDEFTGELINATKVGKGKVAATGGGGGSAANDELDRAFKSATIESVRSLTGDAGYLNKEDYQQIRENLSVAAPKLVTWFDDTYPAERFLDLSNPANEAFLLSPEFRSKGTTPNAGSEPPNASALDF